MTYLLFTTLEQAQAAQAKIDSSIVAMSIFLVVIPQLNFKELLKKYV